MNKNNKRQWLDKRQYLFKFVFWSIEILIVIVLLSFWDMISYTLGINDNRPKEIFAFIIILSILTTINEYVHSRKGSELEMYSNIDTIRYYLEKNEEHQQEILSALSNIEQNLKAPECDTKVTQEEIKEIEAKTTTFNDTVSTQARLKEISAKTANSISPHTLQNAKYETTTSDPFDFDPIEYLIEVRANPNYTQNDTVQKTIRSNYNKCLNSVAYAVTRPATKNHTETVRLKGYNVKIYLQVQTSNGINYNIKITFTPNN